jgi:hypothetical protein
VHALNSDQVLVQGTSHATVSPADRDQQQATGSGDLQDLTAVAAKFVRLG